jgi:predicted component of type VI protein secretion system
VRHVGAPPPSVPLKLGCQYFELVQSGTIWDAIVKSRALDIWVPEEIAEPRLELLLAQ